jgi:hypothetical protein
VSAIRRRTRGDFALRNKPSIVTTRISVKNRELVITCKRPTNWPFG